MALSTISSLDPASEATNSDQRGFNRALKLFREASEHIPAYKDFLKRAKIKPASIRSRSDFAQVPLTDKINYIGNYSLEQMSWGGTLNSARYVSTSSGSTGTPFFWPRGLDQDILVGAMFKNIYERIFDVKRGRTLFVDSFALGTWIAGLEFYNATKNVADFGSNIVMVTPGIDKVEAINQIRKLSPLFDRVVLGGYPPFVKDIIEHGTISGIDWQTFDMRLFFGGEAVSDSWRDKVSALIGKQGSPTAIVNVYGMAEAGVVAHETPVSVLLRKFLRDTTADSGLPGSDTVLGLYQYYPTARYFEIVGETSLVLTANAGLPLIRYDTRDSGGILTHEHIMNVCGKNLAQAARQHRTDYRNWQLPFVYLFGRKDLSISLYALNIYVENIKHALENSRFSEHLSGLFTMGVEHTENLDQQFAVTIELSRGAEPSATLADSLMHEIVASLRKLNTEYSKLHSVVGERAMPKITLVRYGEIQTVPGRKHKWVKRS